MENNNQNVTKIEKSFKFDMTGRFIFGAILIIGMLGPQIIDGIRVWSEGRKINK